VTEGGPAGGEALAATPVVVAPESVVTREPSGSSHERLRRQISHRLRLRAPTREVRRDRPDVGSVDILKLSER
jgi:hypothetical protein